jgi:hypothetical protein
MWPWQHRCVDQEALDFYATPGRFTRLDDSEFSSGDIREVGDNPQRVRSEAAWAHLMRVDCSRLFRATPQREPDEGPLRSEANQQRWARHS